LRKTPFFRQKLAKIAENCYHNIDPRLGYFCHLGDCLLLAIFENYGDFVDQETRRLKVRRPIT
jgi:hypothetical protein